MVEASSKLRLIKNRFLDLPKTRLIRPGERREWVYFLQCEVQPQLLKIGHATNLKWRLTGLQTQCPVQLKLVGAVIGPAGAEFCFHEIFKDERQHGEWFLPSARLLTEIRQLPRGGFIFDRDLRELAARHAQPDTLVEQMLSRVGQHKRCMSDKRLIRSAERASV